MDPQFCTLKLLFWIHTYVHTYISLQKNTFPRFMCLFLVWEQWRTIESNWRTIVWEQFLLKLSLNCIVASKSMNSVLYFFHYYLSFFWEITLTVTHIHSSSYVLFMAFQQFCNPRGWKYFPFATVTRAAERKYEQLQASLIMGSGNTLFRILVHNFSLKEKAGLLSRHLSARLCKDHILDQKWVLQMKHLCTAWMTDFHQHRIGLF